MATEKVVYVEEKGLAEPATQVVMIAHAIPPALAHPTSQSLRKPRHRK